MDKPTEEQIREFWEWCGLLYEGYGNANRLKAKNLPPIDLNNLFKYAVPKLLEEYNIESYSFKQCDNWYYSEVNIWRKGSTKHSFEILHDEHIAKHFEQGTDLDEITALALFWALWQVKESNE